MRRNFGALRQGGRGLCVPAVFALFTRAKRGNAGAIRAPLRAETPSVGGAGVDEHALAAGRVAAADRVDADVGQPDGEAHHGPGGVLVRDGAALGVVHVPRLGGVAGRRRGGGGGGGGGIEVGGG